jgi:hypothetical protein
MTDLGEHVRSDGLDGVLGGRRSGASRPSDGRVAAAILEARRQHLVARLRLYRVRDGLTESPTSRSRSALESPSCPVTGCGVKRGSAQDGRQLSRGGNWADSEHVPSIFCRAGWTHVCQLRSSGT